MQRATPVSVSSLALVVATFVLPIQAQEVTLELSMHPRIILGSGSRGTYVIESKDDISDDHWLARTVLNRRFRGKLDWVDPVVEGTSSRIYRAVEIETRGGRPIENLVWIPAGTFTMGSPPTEEGHWHDEGPQTIVTLSQGFWMGKYEVTQQEYQELVGENPSKWKFGSNAPVDSVSWCDALAYCEKLTEREQMLDRLSDGYVYRLPTEAEWEYACRAGTTTRYSYGEDFAFADLYGAPGEGAGPVGGFRPNTFGLYDMHGSVSEWVLDSYTPYPGGSVTDPVQQGSNCVRMARGGSWEFYDSSSPSRSANRLVGGWGVDDSLGFRIVLAPEVGFDADSWCGN